MKFAAPCLIITALFLSARVWAQDIAADKPYASIVARNMFGLLPIPPPDTNPPAPPIDPPPKITLNGIMTIFGRDQALFKVAVKPKQGQPAKEDAYVLSEGERQEDITVKKINHVNGVVTFDNHGVSQELQLLAAGSGTLPSTPGQGGSGLGFTRPGSLSPAERVALRERQGTRANMNGGGLNPPSSVAQPNAGSGNSFQSSGSQPSEPSIEDKVMNSAREMAQIEQNRLDTQELVDRGLMPPLPPTLLTPPDATAADGTPLIANPNEAGPIPPPPSQRRR